MMINTGLKENSTDTLQRDEVLRSFRNWFALRGKDITEERSTNISADY